MTDSNITTKTTISFTSIVVEQATPVKPTINLEVLTQLIQVNLGKVIEHEATHLIIEFPYPVYRRAFVMQAILNRIPFHTDGDNSILINL